MAKNFKPKGNKVTGTNKKDKIFWQSSSAWQKPLTVHGKGGNDVINFLKSPFNKNKLYGDAGKDTIYGSMRNDFIYGGKGNDILLGNSGDDQIHCGAGLDLVDGGSGKDKIWCDGGANAVSGGSKNDTIYGGTGFDAISGGKGNDVIELKAFSESASTITFTLDKTLSKAFGGKKTITLTKDMRSVVYGGTGHDKITNIQGGIIDGGTGNDTITAISGNNTIYGGGGSDKITGGTGNDYIDAGDSADTITVKGGNNVLKGGRNDDNITGGSGDDTIYGGTGDDTIKAGGGTNEIHYNKGDGKDTIIAGGGDDILVFEDNMTVKSQGTWNGNDLIIKYTSDGTNYGWVTLKDFAKGGHSVHSVCVQGSYHSIEEYVPGAYIKSAPSLKSTPSRNALVAEVAAWQSIDDNGYADVSDSFTGAKEENIIAAVADNYTNQPY